jgi:undecaprenyl diphosphate synthase
MRSAARHVAIIMDGNGRWAEMQAQSRPAGHARGVEAVRTVVRTARDRGIACLTLFAFSAQNWLRPPSEVEALMGLLAEYLRARRGELLEQGIRLLAIGDLQRLPSSVRGPLERLIADSAENRSMTLCLALSYGGREAFLEAVHTIVDAVQDGELAAERIDERTIATALGTAGLPPVDLVIRTSGEQRLSNFLLWETAFAELYFTRRLWPDFGCADLDAALRAYARRQRRFGQVVVKPVRPRRLAVKG